jgi:Flp pilus assembly protein TadD
MAHPSLAGRARRRFAFALLTTTAAAVLLGGCAQISLPFSRDDPKLSTTDAVGAVAKWSAAYAKKPEDPKMAIGYAQELKAIGSRDQALEVLIAGYRTNPDNGELASELGRLALDMGRLEIASQTLKVAEAKGARDWKTLSAQGTLRAKQGKYAKAQQYFLAALQEQPDAVSVINNLALSYALDGKAEKSEELLRKAVASGHDDKRVRQNLALVLGLQGRFEEARKIASVDMTEQEATASLAYLRDMLSSPTQFAAAKPANGGGDDDWMPFAAGEDNTTSKTAAVAPPPAPQVQKATEKSKAAAVAPPPAPQVQVVKATKKIEAPAAPKKIVAPEATPAASPTEPHKVTGTPTLISPVNAAPAEAVLSNPAALY